MVLTASMCAPGSPQDNNPNISTIQVAFKNQVGEWRVVQDFREKSVLNGFSAAGGLGAFISLVCTILFGTSLFSIFFRELDSYSFCIVLVAGTYLDS
jgi:hypothetical protein